jgi:capsular polysaccharide export protein
VCVKMHIERGGRPTYFGRLTMPGDVTLLSRPTNPIGLLTAVDKVYTYSSSMGWDALLCGKEVHVFGTPIYAGWGLTHDRRDLSARRTRTRTLAELFYFIYLRASRYLDPDSGASCTIDRALDYLVENREAFLRQFPDGPPGGTV